MQKSEYLVLLVFTCKNRLRYSRERALESLACRGYWDTAGGYWDTRPPPLNKQPCDPAGIAVARAVQASSIPHAREARLLVARVQRKRCLCNQRNHEADWPPGASPPARLGRSPYQKQKRAASHGLSKARLW